MGGILLFLRSLLLYMEEEAAAGPRTGVGLATGVSA